MVNIKFGFVLRTSLKQFICFLCIPLLLFASDRYDLWLDYDFDREAYEEEAGPSFAIIASPDGEIYGMHFGYGIWLKNTPVFGDYSISLFRNKIEDAAYSGIGLTMRLMPHWKFAPFIGAGGAYNYSLTYNIPEIPSQSEDEPSDRGDSYWQSHAEAGCRLWLNNRIGLLEIAGRYVWTSFSQKDRDYTVIFVSTGTGF